MDHDSSPGWPYMREATTIGDWLKVNEQGKPDEMSVQRLWYDVQQLLRSEEADYYHRVFVKAEPHKRAKAVEGRWRLIVAFPLHVQMVWRMCFSEQNDWLNSHPFTTPSAHGLVFCYGGWRRFVSHAKALQLRYSRDISGWDVNAPGWALMAVKELRKSRGIEASDQRFNDMVDRLYSWAFSNAKMIFSNGMVVQQEYSGFQKSGCFNTIADNSIAMVVMHAVAAVRSGTKIGNIWATGDDVLQSHISDTYIDALESLGCKVKEYEESLTFMGTHYGPEPDPVYKLKHIVAFAYQPGPVRPQSVEAYCRLYAYSAWYPFWRAVAAEISHPVQSQSAYQFWYGSPLARIMKSLW